MARFKAPTVSEPGTYQELGAHDRTPVRELVDERTASSQRWVNADGSFTDTTYVEPKFFQPAGSKDWVDIDSRVVPDAGNPGWFRNAGNSWSARFGPVVFDGANVSGGVVADVEGQQLGFAPRPSAAGEAFLTLPRRSWWK